MKKFEIGSVITIAENYELERSISGQRLSVKKGDTALVKGDGSIMYKSGEAKGMIQMLDPKVFQLEGYDHDNIADMLVKKLDSVYSLFGVFGILEENDINIEDFKEEISDLLMDIL